MTTETTSDDRRAELRGLIERVEQFPEREWAEERQRIAVLQRMLAAEEAAGR